MVESSDCVTLALHPHAPSPAAVLLGSDEGQSAAGRDTKIRLKSLQKSATAAGIQE
jgi:hypothetical protein